MPSGANIGNVYATIGLDPGPLKRGAAEAKATLNDLDHTSSGLATKLTQLGVAAAIAGVAMVAGLVKTGLKAISEQQDLANQLDATIDGLRAVQIAADEAGVSTEGLTKGMAMMNARLGEAQRGTGNAKEALDNLGLSAADLAGMDIDERMATMADRVRELGLSSSQTADVLRQFGIRGGEMVELFRQGGDAIRAARGDVQAFGISLSAIDAKMVDNADESIRRMGLTLEGIRNKVTVALAPILATIADKFNDASKASGGFGNFAVDAVMNVGKALAYLGNVIHGIHVAFKGLEVAVAAVGVVGAHVAKILATMFNPTLAATGVFDEAIDSAKLRLKELKDEFNAVATEPLPTEAWEQFVKDVKAKQEEIAKAQVEARKGGGDGGDYAPADEELARKQDGLRKQLDAVREYGMDEYELLNKQLQDRMDLIREALAERAIAESDAQQLAIDVANKFVEEEQALDQKRLQNAYDLQEEKRKAAVAEYEQARQFALADEEAETEEYERAAARVMQAIEDEVVTREEGYARLEEMEAAHQERIASIREAGMNTLTGFTKASFAQQTKYVTGQMADMTAGVARESKAMFEINKVAGIANAIISAHEGISKTLAVYPYPLSVAMAALQAAAAFAQVKAIASQSFSKGGSAAPSLAGGTPATPVTPVSGGTPNSQQAGGRLMVEGIDPGTMFSGRQMRDLAQRLLEYQRDGGTVVFG